MGKVASFLISGTYQRVAVLKGKAGKFKVELVDKGPSLLEEHADKEMFLSVLYPELVSETVEIPPVGDEDTKLVLIKKQLLERGGISDDLFLVYREVESTPQKKVLKVFAIPKTVVIEGGLLSEETLKESQFFTVCQFSLSGVSKLISPELSIFHVFSDGETLTMTVSSGDDVLYTRSVSIPPYARELGFEDFVHENVNMTYMFVAQRSGIPVDLLLLSGNLVESEELTRTLAEVVGSGIATPLPTGTFSGIDGKTFNEFLPCFGTLHLNGSYDFSPEEIKERRWFKRLVGGAVLFLTLLFVSFLPLFGMRLYEISLTSKSISDVTHLLKTQTSGILKDPILERDTFNYYLNYLNTLDKVRAGNPLTLLKDMEGLLRLVDAKTYALGRQKDTLTLYMEFEKRFPKLIDMTLYREELIKELEALKAKGYSYRVESEVKDLKESRLSMKLRVEKKL
ncbi:hypothetical protein BCF55_0391 [Hydrogenivirga caldilitoris]|uniref:Uncharacterized protein n=1 Tax=Hydrogenivirga caldilitoris TaxID=246264 RepID=A0A497XMJ9_9AQUI|nr:hypothetical protein [Hydrogenivirga caldilitoris]RLJ70127.1 hypothetical protein BCF55_0391 [Hydrogenivirga caldilitoris]